MAHPLHVQDPVRHEMERFSTMLPAGADDPGVHRGARRASRRYPLHADVELVEPVSAEGVVLNVSAGGMRIAIDRPVDVDGRVVARVVTAPGRELFEKARVVWAREFPDGWLIGLEFVEPT